MRNAVPSPATLAYLWAGISIGGPFLAVPAKFQVDTLPLDFALQIGQAQFRWIGTTELIIGIVLIGVVFLGGQRKNYLFVVPVILFFAQYTIVFPLLDARTTAIIAGQAQAPSNLHFIFVAFEVAKALSLLVVATLSKPAGLSAAVGGHEQNGNLIDPPNNADFPTTPGEIQARKQRHRHVDIS